MTRWNTIAFLGYALACGILAGVIMVRPARSHQAPTGWDYPLACCWGPSANRQGDCNQIPFQSVRVGAEGFEITLRPGDHPLVQTDAKQFLIRFEDAMDSPDGEFHLCINPHTGEARCFFAPPFGT